MKLTKEQATAIKAVAFLPADVRAAVDKNVSALGMKRGATASCSNTEFAAVLFKTAVDLGCIPMESLPALMALWDAFPKSPSAFRQSLAKVDDSASLSKAADSILAKFNLGQAEN
jgi:hypothetical protein